jgi:hypothetical protein
MFVVDSSLSVKSDDFESIKTFIREVTGMFDVGATSQVGVFQYAVILPDVTELTTTNEISLGAHNSVYDFNQAVNNIDHKAGKTYTARAMTSAIESFKKSSRFNDAAVTKVMIVLTNARADDSEDLMTVSTASKALGINTFGVGIGGSVRFADLSAMVADRYHQVFMLSRFADLPDIVLEIQRQVKELCNKTQAEAATIRTNLIEQSTTAYHLEQTTTTTEKNVPTVHSETPEVVLTDDLVQEQQQARQNEEESDEVEEPVSEPLTDGGDEQENAEPEQENVEPEQENVEPEVFDEEEQDETDEENEDEIEESSDMEEEENEDEEEDDEEENEDDDDEVVVETNEDSDEEEEFVANACDEQLVCCNNNEEPQYLDVQSGEKCCEYANQPVYQPSLYLCNGTDLLPKDQYLNYLQCGKNSIFDPQLEKCSHSAAKKSRKWQNKIFSTALKIKKMVEEKMKTNDEDEPQRPLQDDEN